MLTQWLRGWTKHKTDFMLTITKENERAINIAYCFYVLGIIQNKLHKINLF